MMPWTTDGVGYVDQSTSTHAAKLKHNSITDITSHRFGQRWKRFPHSPHRIERFGTKADGIGPSRFEGLIHGGVNWPKLPSLEIARHEFGFPFSKCNRMSKK